MHCDAYYNGTFFLQMLETICLMNNHPVIELCCGETEIGTKLKELVKRPYRQSRSNSLSILYSLSSTDINVYH